MNIIGILIIALWFIIGYVSYILHTKIYMKESFKIKDAIIGCLFGLGGIISLVFCLPNILEEVKWANKKLF